MSLYFPVHLNIETSDFCNRSCHYCPVQVARGSLKKQPARFLDLALYGQLLDELAAALDDGRGARAEDLTAVDRRAAHQSALF